MGTTALIDYGAGNLHSVANALKAAGASDVAITADPAVVRAAERIVLPGVGSFKACAEGLRDCAGLEDALLGARPGSKLRVLVPPELGYKARPGSLPQVSRQRAGAGAETVSRLPSALARRPRTPTASPTCCRCPPLPRSDSCRTTAPSHCCSRCSCCGSAE